MGTNSSGNGSTQKADVNYYAQFVEAIEADLSECADEQVKALAAQIHTPLKELLAQDEKIFLRGKYMHYLIKLRGELRKLGKLIRSR